MSNTFKIVGVFFCVILMISVGVVYLSHKIFEGSDAYPFVLNQVKQSDEVRSIVGEVEGINFLGKSYKGTIYPSGIGSSAEYSFTVSGTKNSAKVHTEVATDSSRAWYVKNFQVREK